MSGINEARGLIKLTYGMETHIPLISTLILGSLVNYMINAIGKNVNL